MVCLGNICRSPLAEGILRNKIPNMNVTVDSAGTAGYHIGRKPDPRAIDIAKKNNIDISSLRARKFERSDFINFDNAKLCIVAPLIATTIESYIGATFQDDKKISNELVNLINTFIGSLIAMCSCKIN